MVSADRAADEERFAFGENWREYLREVDDARIAVAEGSLRQALGDLRGLSFLDVGSGSGLFSLAARRLGARVVSFDYDESSVWCTRELRRRYRPDDDGWTVHRGSALDDAFLTSLGEFDVVYAWGVLHHTGRLWDALELTCRRVAPNGRLFISLYNDQGRASYYWRQIKRLYVNLPRALRPVLIALVMLRWVPSTALGDIKGGRNPLERYTGYAAASRGMSVWRDWVDWVGGYPFEVALPGDVFTFLGERDLEMLEMRTISGWGCNEYVARRRA
jgi:2-polyprenyl-6-hydroxyphenyl methylase/3-demethylubiquinone-9 3-methyltransferase